MELPEVGSVVAVQYKRNPRIASDTQLDPRLYFGRVLRHEGAWGFTAALMNCDSVAQETWLEFDQENGWEDKSFGQPIYGIQTSLSADALAFFGELEQMPSEWPPAEEGVRSFDEMRMRFLAGAFEAGWVKPDCPASVYYSDDFPDAAASVAVWRYRIVGKYDVGEERVSFEWPVDDEPTEESTVTLDRREDGTYYTKSEKYGDEFEAKLEKRAGYHLLVGLWSGEGFLSFFGAVLPIRETAPAPAE
jgi:hypothetical protein